jgi:hypothetical protein
MDFSSQEKWQDVSGITGNMFPEWVAELTGISTNNGIGVSHISTANIVIKKMIWD